MAMKLYVGNLSFQTSSEDLRKLFSQAGMVESASVLEDSDRGCSSRAGFVEMSSNEDGQKAIQHFNGKEVNGRRLTINEAMPRKNRAAVAVQEEAVAPAAALLLKVILYYL